jgi:ribosomal 30S subunit maturation factor RimM
MFVAVGCDLAFAQCKNTTFVASVNGIECFSYTEEDACQKAGKNEQFYMDLHGMEVILSK